MFPLANQKNTRTTKRKQYRSMLSRWQQFQNQVSTTDFVILTEITEALKHQPETQVAPVAMAQKVFSDFQFTPIGYSEDSVDEWAIMTEKQKLAYLEKEKQESELLPF